MKSLIAHPGMKALALFIALIFWTLQSAPRREKLIERPSQVPLSLVGIPRDLIVTTRVPDSVSVRLRGRPSDLNGVMKNIGATLDLSDTRAGDVQIAIRPQAFNLPHDIEIVSVDPPSVPVRLDERRNAIVPIRPYPVGVLPPGFTLGEITVTPSVCEISGPATLIRNVTETATERVILSGRTQSFQTTVGVVSDQPLVQVVSPTNVVVTVNVIPPLPDDVSTDTTDTATGEAAASPTPR